jgi:hypothetical protein
MIEGSAMRIVIFIVAVAYAPWCQAALVYLSQTRSAGAFAVVTPGDPADNKSSAAPDFAPFSAQVSAAGVLNDGSPAAGTYSLAISSINSVLAGNAITASGQSESGARGGVFLGPSAAGSAKSLLDVSFTVDTTADYFLSGVLHVYGRVIQPEGLGPPVPVDVALALTGPSVGFSADLKVPDTGFNYKDISLPISQLFHLIQGAEYELSVSATAIQSSAATLAPAPPPATIDAIADYSITLAPVLEPSSVCLVASALVFLAVPLRRRQCRATSTRRSTFHGRASERR